MHCTPRLSSRSCSLPIEFTLTMSWILALTSQTRTSGTVLCSPLCWANRCTRASSPTASATRTPTQQGRCAAQGMATHTPEILDVESTKSVAHQYPIPPGLAGCMHRAACGHTTARMWVGVARAHDSCDEFARTHDGGCNHNPIINLIIIT
jgi:hypothetical protein